MVWNFNFVHWPANAAPFSPSPSMWRGGGREHYWEVTVFAGYCVHELDPLNETPCLQWWIQGRCPPPPTLFSDQTEAWRAEKFFFGDRALLISRSGSGTRLYGKNCPLGLNGQSVILRCLYSQEGGGLPLMAYMGRLCPKGVPFPGLRYMKG